jgi:hypothetical protein
MNLVELNYYSFQNQRNEILKSWRIIAFRDRKTGQNQRDMCHTFDKCKSRNRSAETKTQLGDGRQEKSWFDFRLDRPLGPKNLLFNALWDPFSQG